MKIFGRLFENLIRKGKGFNGDTIEAKKLFFAKRSKKMGFVLGSLFAIDIFYLYGIIAPPDKKAILYFLDRHYYNQYECLNDFYSTSSIHIFNDYIPYGLTTAHIHAQNPVDYGLSMLNEEKYSKKGVVKFLDLMNRVSDREDLIQYGIKKDIFPILLKNAQKLDYSYDLETYKLIGTCYSPLFQFFSKLSKDSILKLSTVPDLERYLIMLLQTQPLTVCLILSRLHARPTKITNPTYVQIMDTLRSVDINPDKIGNWDKNFFQVKKFLNSTFFIYIRWFAYAQWLHLPKLGYSNLFTMVSLRSIDSISAYIIAQFATMFANQYVLERFANSENWKLTSHAAVLLHGSLFLSGYFLLKRSPFILFPMVYTMLFQEKTISQSMFKNSVPMEFGKIPFTT